jgi:hypothetical protein
MNATATGQPLAKSSRVNLERKRCPVFVMGCHRSGTNLLYDMLLSAGGFAVYRGYLPLYESLLPRFGSLDNPGNRQKIVAAWMRSKGFRRAGVDAEPLRARLLAEAHTGGDFIRIVMDAIAEKQNAQRWAVYDPDNLLHVPQISREIPGALFLHIIRDGRDIALSLMKMEGFRPFPWRRQARGLLETALYWEWMVRKGRQYGSRTHDNYLEVHYEELVKETPVVLERLGKFLDHDLDYDRIQHAGLGRIRESNSSFLEDAQQAQRPVQRWKERLAPKEIAELETLIGPALEDFGYLLSLAPEQRKKNFRTRCLGSVYPLFLESKQWLKTSTPVGRLSSLSALEIQSTDSESD